MAVQTNGFGSSLCALRFTDERGRCPGCGSQGFYRDTVIRKVTDVPVVGHPLRLRVRVPRYRCPTAECDREVFAHNTSQLARPGVVNHPPVRPLDPAPTDARPDDRLGGGPRAVGAGRSAAALTTWLAAQTAIGAAAKP